MRALTCFVILSLGACRGAGSTPDAGGTPNMSGAVAASGTDTVLPDTPQAPDTRDNAKTIEAAAPDTAIRHERPPVRLIEQRGDALSTVQYRIIAPDTATATTPIVLALHGRGDTAAGFMGLARRLEFDARVVVAEAPLPFGNIGGRQWFEAATAESLRPRLDELEALLGRLATEFPEAGKPVVLGFSQGAMLAMLFAAERPEKIAAAVALSGRLVDHVGVKDVETPVLVVAGTKDGIIRQEDSWSAADALSALGRQVERFSFVGAHTVPPAVIEATRVFVAKVTVKVPEQPKPVDMTNKKADPR